MRQAVIAADKGAATPGGACVGGPFRALKAAVGTVGRRASRPAHGLREVARTCSRSTRGAAGIMASFVASVATAPDPSVFGSTRAAARATRIIGIGARPRGARALRLRRRTRRYARPTSIIGGATRAGFGGPFRRRTCTICLRIVTRNGRAHGALPVHGEPMAVSVAAATGVRHCVKEIITLSMGYCITYTLDQRL